MVKYDVSISMIKITFILLYRGYILNKLVIDKSDFLICYIANLLKNTQKVYPGRFPGLSLTSSTSASLAVFCC